MTMPPIHRLAEWYAPMIGVMLIVLGIVTFVRPSLLEYYAIGLNEPSARVAIRAMIGGAEFGIGSFLLAGHRIGLDAKAQAVLVATILLSVGFARLLAVVIDHETLDLAQPLREGMLEMVLGALGIYAARQLHGYTSGARLDKSDGHRKRL